ncbi:hypothetical protein LCGC14_1413520, partial [marine sediment metagenome]
MTLNFSRNYRCIYCCIRAVKVVVQDEPLQAEVRSVLEGAGRPPSVAWHLQVPGQRAVELTASKLHVQVGPDMPDGPVTIIAQLFDKAGENMATLTREMTLAGKALTAWQTQASGFQARLDKLRPAVEKTKLATYLDKTADKIKRLGGMLKRRRLPQARSAVADIDHHLGALEKGASPVWGHHGMLYTSKIDGTRQPYTVSIPKGYDPGKKDRWPVLIWLHCYWGAGRWPANAVRAFTDPIEMACMKKGFIFVHPFGRGSNWYANDAETDFHDVWRAVNARWRIDPDRVYLAGFSMGGTGTGRLAAAHPHLFAAAAMFSGELSMDKLSNLRHLPVRLEAGGQEPVSAHMAKMARALEQMEGRKAETVYASDPNVGHTREFVDFEALLDWFAPHRRVADPSVVTYATDQLRHHRGYWVSIDRLVDYGELARVDARVVGDTLKVSARNVAEMTLTPPAKLLGEARTLKVTLNGKQVKAARTATGAIHLRIAGAPPPGVRKTKALAGPIRDAFTGPLMLVAASADAPNVEAAKIVSERWRHWHHGELPVRIQASTPAKDMAARNVILVGPWDGKGLMGKLAKAAPVKIGPDGITVSGKRTEGKDLGIIFIQPSPLNRSRYVVAVTGHSPKAVLAACKMFAQGKYGGDYTLTAGKASGVF